MKTAMKRVASLLLALIMILEVVAPGVVEARSAGQNRATVSDEEFIPPDGNRIDPDQNAGSHLPNFIDPDDDGYYTPPQKAPARPAQNAPAQAAPKQGNEANDVEVSEEKAPADEAKPQEAAKKAPAKAVESLPYDENLELEFNRVKERVRVGALRGAGELDGKKFTVRTRFDTSTVVGPIKKGQYFVIHLDDELTVKPTTVLENLSYKGELLATPEYNDLNNTIKYTLVRDLAENVKLPLNIDVDFNTANIPEGKSFTVTNSVSGLGVTRPTPLLPVVVDANGNVTNTIIEKGHEDDVVIIDNNGDESYKVDADAVGEPVVENGELQGINWMVKIVSDKDLYDLGLKANFTTVKGSGLGTIENVKINGGKANVTSQLQEKLGIVDSKHHSLDKSAHEIYYSFYTKRTNIQGDYMLDLSVFLKQKNKTGAVRLVVPGSFTQAQIREATPTRVGMNNHTTILGEFSSDTSALWTITDQVSSNEQLSLPLKDRTLEGGQTLKPNGGRMAVYGLDTEGNMVVKPGGAGQETTILDAIPSKGTAPLGLQNPGTIAVYQYDTTLPTPEDKNTYAVSGVAISKYEDLVINQEWSMPDSSFHMPKQTIKVVDADDKTKVLGKVTAPKDTSKKIQRFITIPGTRYWNIASNGTATRIEHKIDQGIDELNNDPVVTGDGTVYKYYENVSYFKTDNKIHYIQNMLARVTDETPANFTILKKDEETSKALPGAEFKLVSGDKPGLEAATGPDGKARFNNVAPGAYRLFETKAPKGYKLDSTTKYVYVSQLGKVSISGDNMTLEGGANATGTVKDPNWPDYMNAMHYGTIDGNGNYQFYIYLKALDKVAGGKTDKNTHLSLGIDAGTVSNVEVYDVGPASRSDARRAMSRQSMSQSYSSYGPQVLNQPHTYKITGQENSRDSFTGKTGYRINFPTERFGTDWGFLVRVTGQATNPNDANFYYDWLTDENTGNNAKIQQNIKLTAEAGGGDEEITINMTNEAIASRPVKITKIKDDKDGTPLPGASFTLKDSDGNPTTKVSNNEGVVDFGELPEGQYTIEETRAPNEFQKSDVIFDVTVDESSAVTYKARFKDGNGTPVPNVDYIISNEEIGKGDDISKITSVSQEMILDENKPGVNIGTKTGIWEAYELESYTYKATITVDKPKAGRRLKIQFDKNLDFKHFVNEIPKIYDVNDKNTVIAEPYMDYETNLLTYVFNNNVKDELVTANIKISGIIPDKYYAKDSGTYSFENVVDPGGNAENRYPFTVQADYGSYNTSYDSPAMVHEMLNTFEKDGELYLKVMSYYNPLVERSKKGARNLDFDWMSATRTQNYAFAFEAKGEPAFALDDIKIYSVLPSYDANGNLTNAMHMPLSFGIRPEQDPFTYNLVYHKGNINPKQDLHESSNGFNINYDPNKITTSGRIGLNPPLTIRVPAISRNNEGYVIEHVFKVTDKEKFTNLWRLFYYSTGPLKESSYHKGNDSVATADQTGQEIPKYYTQVVKLINKKYTPAQFKITKLNASDQKEGFLAGAVFSLTDADGNAIYRSSGANGEVNFTGLKPGTYRLIETKAPEGYTKSDKMWQVNINSEGVVTITEIGLNSDGTVWVGKELNLPVTNKPTGKEFIVYKKDEKNNPLPGAKFKLTKQTPEKPTVEGKSDNNGVVRFDKPLTEGLYILEETEAPDGYKLLEKKWVVEVDANNKIKVYDYVEKPSNPTDQKFNLSLLGEAGTKWVNVRERPLSGWTLDDNRWTGYTEKHSQPYKMGTRIIGINKTGKYVIQRYVINPEAASIGASTAWIHREKPEYNNMDWYNGNKGDKDIRIFTLNNAVTGNVEDIRLENYIATDITKNVSIDRVLRSGQYQMQLDFPATSNPIIVDVKVPYTSEDGGVGTGMDILLDGELFWKSDYYEQVSTIKEGSLVKEQGQESSIKGAQVAEDTLDVGNVPQRYNFKIKKVKQGTTDAVSGATFKLVGPKPDTTARYERSGEDGFLSFTDLAPGTYTLNEDGAAQGYEKINTTWTVIVEKDGKTYIRDNNPATAEGEWQSVDTTSHNGARRNQDDEDGYVKTHITEVDKQAKKFRQVFIVNQPGRNINNPTLEIHAQPETRNLTTANTKVLSVQVVDATSLPDKIAGTPQDVSFNTGMGSKGGYDRLVVSTNVTGNKTLAVTIESDLPDSAPIGTGMDFKNPDRTYWGAESYTGLDGILFKPTTGTGSNGGPSFYVGDDNGTANRAPALYSRQAESVESYVLGRYKALADEGLELGPENIPTPVGAGGMEPIDPSRSDKPDTRANPNDPVQVSTKITHINKGDHKFKQVFLIDGSVNKDTNFALNLHRQPNGTLNKDEIVVKVFSVANGSTVDNLMSKKAINIKALVQDNYNTTQVRVNFTGSPKTQKFAIEVESTYTPGSPVGLGMDYFYKVSGHPSTWPKYWGASSYASESGINKPMGPKITYEEREVRTELPIPTEPIKRPNDQMVKGQEKEVFAGQAGYKIDIYKYKLVDNVVQPNPEFVRTKEKVDPKPKIIEYGTKDPTPSVTTRTVSEENTTPIPFEEQKIVDTSLNPGETKIERSGVDGKIIDTYSITFEKKAVGAAGQDAADPADWPADILQSLKAKRQQDEWIRSFDKSTSRVSPTTQIVYVGPESTPGDNDNPQAGDTLIPDGGFVSIPNKVAGLELKVLKRDAIDRPLNGAKFTLKKMKDATYETPDTTFETVKATAEGKDEYDNAKGEVIFRDNKTGDIVKLAKGYYLLEETEAPTGFKKAPAPWKIEIKDDGGRMYAVYKGPEETPESFIDSEYNKPTNDTNTNHGIKVASKITYINPTASTTTTTKDGKTIEVGTFVQRIFIDTRGYNGADKINVQIIPKNKREETDYVPPKPPDPIKSPTVDQQGVKTAYRTTYKLDGAPQLPSDDQINDILSNYDLSNPNVTMVNTARWRPFNWGFDEDQLNLDKGGVYFIDVEGYYDRALIDGGDNISDEDKEKLALNVEFYARAREFQQAYYNEKTKTHVYRAPKKGEAKASYQAGNVELAKEYGKAWSGDKTTGEKYDNWLSRQGGQIYPALSNASRIRTATTTFDLGPLYSSDTPTEIPKTGLKIKNAPQTYNITFSKHGRDDRNLDINDDKVTNNRLEGAVFRLEKQIGNTWDDVNGSYVSSAFNGYFGFRGLSTGRYRLVEVKAPTGYRPIQGPILYMTIAHSRDEKDETTGYITPGKGSITLEYEENANGVWAYAPVKGKETDNGTLVDFVTAGTAKNMGKVIDEKPGKGKVTIEKKGGDGKALNGAKFTLKRTTAAGAKDGNYSGTTTKTEIEEGKYVDGVYIFDELPIGYYELKETGSPEGHINNGQTWHFTVGGEGLDPYAGEIRRTGSDLTSKITLQESKMTVVRPDPNDPDAKSTDNTKIDPHRSQSMDFENTFKVDDGTKIQPGDYFTIKLSPNMDLKGIYTGDVAGLDIFADGVGTIAKADYDKDAGTVTYTFTEYAKAGYDLTSLTNKLNAHISLANVKYSEPNVPVGIKMAIDPNDPNDPKDYKNRIEVKYNLGTIDMGPYNYNYNMSSKIVSYNHKTGEFTQYFYINRLGKTQPNFTFAYYPSKKVSDVEMHTFYAYGDNTAKEKAMPESYAVNDDSLAYAGFIPNSQILPQYGARISYPALGTYTGCVVKVTGKVADEDLSTFEATGYMLDPNSNLWLKHYSRVFYQPNTTAATAKLIIPAVNPKNKISFKKVNADGTPLPGASFILKKQNESGGWDGGTNGKSTDEKGTVTFTGLKPGKYRLSEAIPPKGYVPLSDEDLDIEFDVLANGRITRVVKSSTGKNVSVEEDGSVPITIVNHKPIEFIKQDKVDRKGLKGAEFKLLYKAKEGGTYATFDYKENGKKTPIISTDGGKFRLSLSKPGYYALEETKAPEGYIKPMGRVKEFAILDGKIKLREKALQGMKIPKDPMASTDAKESMIYGGVLKDSSPTGLKTLDMYYVINPDHEEKTYSPGDTFTITYASKNIGNRDDDIQVYRMEKGQKASEMSSPTTLNNSERIAEGSAVKVDLFEAAGGKGNEPVTSSKRLIIKVPALDMGEDTDDVILTKIQQGDTIADARYSFKPDDTWPISVDALKKSLSDGWQQNVDIFVDYKEDNPVPIPIDNSKGTYPFTGGFGPHRWIVIIGAVIAAVAAEEYIRRKRTSAPKGGA